MTTYPHARAMMTSGRGEDILFVPAVQLGPFTAPEWRRRAKRVQRRIEAEVDKAEALLNAVHAPNQMIESGTALAIYENAVAALHGLIDSGMSADHLESSFIALHNTAVWGRKDAERLAATAPDESRARGAYLGMRDAGTTLVDVLRCEFAPDVTAEVTA